MKDNRNKKLADKLKQNISRRKAAEGQDYQAENLIIDNKPGDKNEKSNSGNN